MLIFLPDKFCLASASTHRHACRCTCVPVLLRLRAYRELHPPRQRRKGGDPPALPSSPFRCASLPGQCVPPPPQTRGHLAQCNCRGTPPAPLPTRPSLATVKALLSPWPKGSDSTRPPWSRDTTRPPWADTFACMFHSLPHFTCNHRALKHCRPLHQLWQASLSLSGPVINRNAVPACTWICPSRPLLGTPTPSSMTSAIHLLIPHLHDHLWPYYKALAITFTHSRPWSPRRQGPGYTADH